MPNFKRVVYFLMAMCWMLVAQAENLYTETDYRALTSDRRAYQRGDILTVIVLENSSATATAGTNTDKGYDAGIRFLSPTSQKNYSLGVEDGFDGNGRIARTGRLLAQLSVLVTDVAKNGDLLIEGEQLIEINDEKQAINIQGRVRQRDIEENNTVISSKIADANIKYVGDGVLADNQRKGWLSKLMIFLGLL